MAALFRRFLKLFRKHKSSTPQLRMIYRFGGGEELSPPVLPRGYRLGCYAAGAENDWISLLGACGFSMFSTDGSTAALEREILQGLLPGGGIFAYAGDKLVACASACSRPEFAPNAVLMYVGVLPEHRRHGLGTAVTAGVLAVSRRAGYPGLTLLTDETRIPAIRTYLRLGFVPDESVDNTTRRRWERVLRMVSRENHSGER
jgi:mycothiol synthase